MSRRWLAMLVAISLLNPAWYLRAEAQTPVQQAPDATSFDVQQIDALVAPIALYPDQLLTQVLIASTFPLQVVEAARWQSDPAHAALTGDALTKALQPLSWDPSVKSLVPFPQVLSQLNGNLEWTQQLGYAFANQQKDVLDSVQRLRRQAQAQGHLQSTSQQVIRTEPSSGGSAGAGQTIIIEPASPSVVYVPSYNPAVVYGTWPYPAYPPVVAAPSPAYVAGAALLGGLDFGAGVAISSSLWGWSSPNWGGGNVNVNVNRWNNINVNRQRAVSNTWSPALNRGGGRAANLQRPPAGPVGRPARNAGLPANAIGRRNVNVPGNLVNRPARPNGGGLTPGNRPNLNPGSRPRPSGAGPQFGGQGRRPGGSALGQGGAGQRFQPRQQGGFQRPGGGAFGGLGDGNRAAQFGQRGSQSRQFGNFQARRGGGFRGGERRGGFQGGGFHGGFHGRR
jgi:hypothetical protein